MQQATSMSSEIALKSLNYSCGSESMVEDSNGVLQIDVDRSKVPFRGYDKWSLYREELAERGIYASTAPRIISGGNFENFHLKVFPKLTENFIENNVLKYKGDFCVWKKYDGTLMLAVQGYDKCLHFRIAHNHNGFFIASAYGVVGKTLEELILKLYMSPMNVITTIAGIDITLVNYVCPQSTECYNYFTASYAVTKTNMVITTRRTKVYQGFINKLPIIIFEHQKSNFDSFEEIIKEVSVSQFLKDNVINASSVFYLLNYVQIEDVPYYRVYPQTVFGNLHSFLTKDVFTIEEKLRCVFNVALAISELHRFNIVHCNIRPKMIFVDAASQTDDFCYLLGGLHDISAETQRCNPYANSHLRMIAPEVFKTFLFTKETDVYAFGVTVWEIFAGREHCQGQSAEVLVQNTISSRKNGTFDYDVDIPNRIIDLVNLCCQRDKTKRPTINGCWMILSDFITP